MASEDPHSTPSSPDRKFTSSSSSPWDSVDWVKHPVQVTNTSGEITFKQHDVEAPIHWSETAVAVVASTYFHGNLKDADRERSVKDLLSRVVDTITTWGKEDGYFSGDDTASIFRDELTHALLYQMCSFNSPVWFNVGIEEQPQCSACFILAVEDSLESLLSLQQTEARLFKYGSGAGTNLSSIRSSFEKLEGGGEASGPVSFMRGYDAWASVVKSGGKTRRAAKIQILNADHPDILEFIECKAKEEKKARALIAQGYDSRYEVQGGAYDSVAFQNSNISVRVSDKFMQAVVDDGNYWTKEVLNDEPCKELSAKDVLRRMAEASHYCGDPGIQFDDTINSWHTCPESGRINASNPCSEYMHLDNSACNLASINLLSFFTEDGKFCSDSFLHTVELLVIAQDAVIDRSSYPLQEVGECARAFRQLGLGFSNLGATLMSLGIPYDSEAGRSWAATLTALLCGQAYLTSSSLAKNLGAFSGFKKNREAMLSVIRKHALAVDEIPSGCPAELRKLAGDIWQKVEQNGKKFGFRNSQATVIAPTGTISFMMDCDTTGIEPDLALTKTKHLADGGSLVLINASLSKALQRLGYSEEVTEQIIAYVQKNGSVEGSPDLLAEHLPVFDCALKPAHGNRSIHYSGHLKMMAAVQPFLSGAISKTVNLPQDVSVDEIVDIYLQAWRLGLKSVALYRDSSKLAQPLSSQGQVNEDGSITYLTCPIEGGCG